MQQLVWSEVTLTGGKAIDQRLPAPLVRLGHYRDAMVIAFPALPGDRANARGQIVRTTLDGARSEEHTSELQSLMRISYAVFCLKKKKKHLLNYNITRTRTHQ